MNCRALFMASVFRVGVTPSSAKTLPPKPPRKGNIQKDSVWLKTSP